MKAFLTAILAFPLASLLSAGQPMPAGWFLAGDRPAEYAVSIETTAHSGKNAARLACVAAKPSGFGTLMQMFDATKYRGKRLRLTAYVKTLDVTGWAGLWMRVDGSSGPSLAFDNMQDRPIKGTTAWIQYNVVLDVPEVAQAIAFGVLLNGAGTAWVDDFDFEIVGSQVAPSGKPALPRSPQNLGFEN
jgi:hypothetical protein